MQVNQNKCIRFSLKLNSRHQVGAKKFKEINWLPTNKRVEERVTMNIFKYWNGTSPFHVNELFVTSRNKTLKNYIKNIHTYARVKSSISIFNESLASIDKIFFLRRRLGTRSEWNSLFVQDMQKMELFPFYVFFATLTKN